MRAVLAAAVVSTAITATLVGASRADGAYLERFSVRDAGAKIVWAITVCDTPRIRAFSARLEPEDIGVPWTRKWPGARNRFDCTRWTLSAADVWSEQVWWSRLTVVTGDGQILRTQWKDFYNDD